MALPRPQERPKRARPHRWREGTDGPRAPHKFGGVADSRAPWMTKYIRAPAVCRTCSSHAVHIFFESPGAFPCFFLPVAGARRALMAATRPNPLCAQEWFASKRRRTVAVTYRPTLLVPHTPRRRPLLLPGTPRDKRQGSPSHPYCSSSSDFILPLPLSLPCPPLAPPRRLVFLSSSPSYPSCSLLCLLALLLLLLSSSPSSSSFSSSSSSPAGAGAEGALKGALNCGG